MQKINLLRSLDADGGPVNKASSLMPPKRGLGPVLAVAAMGLSLGLGLAAWQLWRRSGSSIAGAATSTGPSQQTPVVKETARTTGAALGPSSSAGVAETGFAEVPVQIRSCLRALEYLERTTTPRIGLTDCIFSVPGEMYLRGQSPGPDEYSRFKERLSADSAVRVKEGILKPLEKTPFPAEFSLYLTFLPPADGGEPKAILAPQQVNAELDGFRRLAKSSGLPVSRLELSDTSSRGGVVRKIYAARAGPGSFSQFHDLIRRMEGSGSRIGIVKFSLKAVDKEQLVASLDLTAYSR